MYVDDGEANDWKRWKSINGPIVAFERKQTTTFVTLMAILCSACFTLCISNTFRVLCVCARVQLLLSQKNFSPFFDFRLGFRSHSQQTQSLFYEISVAIPVLMPAAAITGVTRRRRHTEGCACGKEPGLKYNINVFTNREEKAAADRRQQELSFRSGNEKKQARDRIRMKMTTTTGMKIIAFFKILLEKNAIIKGGRDKTVKDENRTELLQRKKERKSR